MKKTIQDLIEISTYAGDRVDYTQGGGGNTSVKKDGVMLIKASGYRLVDITKKTAFVAVDKEKIENYYQSVDLAVKKDYEKESAEISKSSVIAMDGIETLRPSVEVGFHAILKKYVIHTHSVYANIITCSVEGEAIAEKLFSDKDFGYIFMPYINPGFELTLAMKTKIENYVKEKGKFPEVIFMKNHGLVVTADYIERVKAINTDVNETIRKYFDIEDTFRSVELEEIDGGYRSNTKTIVEFVSKNGLTKALLDEKPLYPDQLVYLNNILAFSPETMTVKDKTVEYKVDLKKATTLEETLFAYLFVIESIKNAGLIVSIMNEKEVDFINNWEAEKYRRSVK
ncbi:MAG: class II aldolase/adducin family protein [Clostridia bacterium]|nr:class II aldolase/adducin family protein [Clostridia bacterium]